MIFTGYYLNASLRAGYQIQVLLSVDFINVIVVVHARARLYVLHIG